MVRRRHRLKSTKYDYELRSLRGAAASVRLLGAGNAPLHRFRVGLEFALSGHKELDDMIAEPRRGRARMLGEQLGLPDAVARRARQLLRAVGRARLAGRA